MTDKALHIGVVQFACSDKIGENIATASRLVRQAAAKGAKIILVQELFSGCWQTNSNQSLFAADSVNLCETKEAPLGESGGTVQLEVLA